MRDMNTAAPPPCNMPPSSLVHICKWYDRTCCHIGCSHLQVGISMKRHAPTDCLVSSAGVCAGEHYTETRGTLVFNGGETRALIRIPLSASGKPTRALIHVPQVSIDPCPSISLR